MMNTVFYKCVDLLEFLAAKVGMTYEAINVWIFVILWPIFTVVLIIVLIVQQLRIRKLSG